MPVPRRYITDAIVLSRFDLGEADRVLTLITPGIGKLKAIAKGVRRPTSRLGGSLEPFAELTVALARGRTFDVVTQVSVGHAWLGLRDSLECAATAWYLAELADRSLEERHAAEPLYALLRRAYELLDAGMAPGRVARWYEMHLARRARRSGPRWTAASSATACSRRTERFRWVPPLGGVLCERCPGPPHDRTGLSLEALKLLKAYQRLDIEALAALRLARRRRARGRGRAARVRARRARARRRARWRSSTRSAHARCALMATVELRDIVTEADRAAVARARVAPGPGGLRRERRDSRSADAIDDARACPRMWSVVRRRPGRRLRHDQRRDPAERLASDDDLIGPYFLWRLLIDEHEQRAGLRNGDPRRGRRLPRGRSGADVAVDELRPGDRDPAAVLRAVRLRRRPATSSMTSRPAPRPPREADDRDHRSDPEAGARALERLDADRIGWLTTVTPDGQPQSSRSGSCGTTARSSSTPPPARAPEREHRDQPLVSFHLNTTPAAATS